MIPRTVESSVSSSPPFPTMPASRLSILVKLIALLRSPFSYVNEPTALARNLTSFDATTFTMRADSTNIVAPEARGRDSIRIASRKTYADVRSPPFQRNRVL
jgi:hypothetical protein